MLLTGLTTISYITANDSSCQPRHRRRQNQNSQAEVAGAVNLPMGKHAPDLSVAVLLFCCSLHVARNTSVAAYFLAMFLLYFALLRFLFAFLQSLSPTADIHDKVRPLPITTLFLG